MELDTLNHLSDADAQAWFAQACATQSWCQQMASARPFRNVTGITEQAQRIWQTMTNADYLEAFEAHPMIGDVNSLKAKFRDTQSMASHEQSGAQAASEATLQALHDLNQQYLKNHGFIFIICATGKSAHAMLAALQARVDNDTATEITLAAAEQIKITLLRIRKNLKTETAL